jgi:hypothetical protein
MTRKTSIALLATGIVSLLALGSPNRADADWRSRQKKLDQAAARRHQSGHTTELRKDRAELRRDQAELERDRDELRRLYRSGASRDEITRKKGEIRQDLAEIDQGRQEIRDDLRQLERSQDRYGNSGWGNDGWFGNWGGSNRSDSGWWGRGNDRWSRDNNRWSQRDRWGYDRYRD